MSRATGIVVRRRCERIILRGLIESVELNEVDSKKEPEEEEKMENLEV